MSNCTGIIYGLVTNAADGSPISGATVDLNWVQEAQGGPLRIGGNDALTTPVPLTTTTSAGEYIIPFFWASEQVPGSAASAHVMRFYADNSYTSMNLHGLLGVGVDVKKLIGIAAPPIPASGSSAASMFLTFFLAATPELKGMGILKRFVQSTKFISAELQGCYSRIDFSLPYQLGSY